MLADLKKYQRRDYFRCVQSLPWRWTEVAAPWISQQLGLLVLHIAGVVLCIALCCCGQCLLTVGGNLLPHTVTPCDVTTVAWCCRQTQGFLHPAEWLPGTQQTEWQWTTRGFTTWHCTGRCSSLFTADKCFQQYLTLWFRCWTGVADKWVSCYFPLRYISLNSCQPVLCDSVDLNEGLSFTSLIKFYFSA